VLLVGQFGADYLHSIRLALRIKPSEHPAVGRPAVAVRVHADRVASVERPSACRLVIPERFFVDRVASSAADLAREAAGVGLPAAIAAATVHKDALAVAAFGVLSHVFTFAALIRPKVFRYPTHRRVIRKVSALPKDAPAIASRPQ
jgi:hypothetical protein